MFSKPKQSYVVYSQEIQPELQLVQARSEADAIRKVLGGKIPELALLKGGEELSNRIRIWVSPAGKPKAGQGRSTYGLLAERLEANEAAAAAATAEAEPVQVETAEEVLHAEPETLETLEPLEPLQTLEIAQERPKTRSQEINEAGFKIVFSGLSGKNLECFPKENHEQKVIQAAILEAGVKCRGEAIPLGKAGDHSCKGFPKPVIPCGSRTLLLDDCGHGSEAFVCQRHLEAQAPGKTREEKSENQKRHRQCADTLKAMTREKARNSQYAKKNERLRGEEEIRERVEDMEAWLNRTQHQIDWDHAVIMTERAFLRHQMSLRGEDVWNDPLLTS